MNAVDAIDDEGIANDPVAPHSAVVCPKFEHRNGDRPLLLVSRGLRDVEPGSLESAPMRFLPIAAATTTATVVSIVALLLSTLSATVAIWSALIARRNERRSHYDLVLEASVLGVSLGNWPQYPRLLDFHVELRNRGRAPVQVEDMFVDVVKWRRRTHREYLQPERTWGENEDLKLPHLLAGLSSKTWIIEDIVLPDALVERRKVFMRVRLGPGEVISSEVIRPTWLIDPDLQMHLHAAEPR